MASTSSYSSTPLRSRVPTSTSNSSLQDDPYSQSPSQAQSQPLLSNRTTSLNTSSGLAKQKGGKHGGVSNTSPALLPPAEKALLVLIALLAAVVRFWKIGQPSSVVFDEVHFGGFASKYINQKFFMDVHPPLAKLMIAGTAYLAGFDGKFDFKDISKEYLIGDNTPVPYVAIRSMCALLGTLTVPIAYLTLRALSLRATTALVGALLVTFDNALMTQSRHILLDSPLIFFTAFTIYGWVSFCNEEKRAPFSRRWWGWLSLTGLSLGAVASVKWVGLFTISTIGICVIIQLWGHLGDVKQPMSTLGKHFIARSICLIGLPIFVYLTAFAIHLGVLGRSGEGDGFMSPEFQHTLRGHGMQDTYADVSLGSTITIKHRNTQGGYLHSHLHNYPTGSGQQQITLYPHRDENNEWYVIKAPGPDEPPPPTDDQGVPLPTEGPHEIEKYMNVPVEYLKHGMEIRLIHRKSDKRLHSHESNRPPVTEADYQNEVTGYGFPGFAGDNNDNFMVEIDKGDSGDRESSSRVKALRTTFRLRHTLTGCYLFSHKIALPDWGFGQQEVTCNKNPSRPNSLWFIETNTHPQLEAAVEGNKKKAQMVNYRRPGFFDKFWELQGVMWATNAGLTDRHAYDSRPKSWPVLRRGINFWNKEHRQVYLMGNPLIWWGATASIMAYLGARAILMLRAQRGKKDFYDSTVVFYDQTCGFLTLGWAMHYLPFHAMNRQLFIHHYLPALYFSILLMSVIFDFITSTLRPRFRLGAALVVILISILSFSRFAPLAYAGDWTVSECESARWLKTWDFDCRSFPQDRKDYIEKHFPPAIHTVPHVKIGEDSKANATSAPTNDVPEPGRHAFENAPAKAYQSDGIEHAQQVHQIDVEEAENLVQAGEGKEKAEPTRSVDPEAVVPEGLDAEQFEAAILQGTAKADLSGKEEKVRSDVGADGKPAPSPHAAKVVEAPAEDDDVKIRKED